jgi:hypothetical protein
MEAPPFIGEALIGGARAGRKHTLLVFVLPQHFAQNVGDVTRTKLAHDVGAVKLDGAVADSQNSCRLLAGQASQHMGERNQLLSG